MTTNPAPPGIGQSARFHLCKPGNGELVVWTPIARLLKVFRPR
jgi:hypothetical protein